MTATDSHSELIERAVAAAIGIVAAVGHRNHTEKLRSGDSYTKGLAKVTLFLQDKDRFGSLRWLVKFEGLDWNLNVIVNSEIERSLDISDWGDDPSDTSGKYTWPYVENAEEQVLLEGRQERAFEWLKKHSGDIVLDWSTDIQEREEKKEFQIVKYVVTGLAIILLLYILA